MKSFNGRTRSTWPTRTRLVKRSRIGRVIALNPAHYLALEERCFALNRAGRRDEAMADCRDAINAEPKSPRAHLFLGRAMQDAGSHGSAIEELSRRARPEARLYGCLLCPRRQLHSDDGIRQSHRRPERGPGKQTGLPRSFLSTGGGLLPEGTLHRGHRGGVQSDRQEQPQERLVQISVVPLEIGSSSPNWPGRILKPP